jgi:hypothetical protein
MSSYLVVTETKLNTDKLIRVISESFFENSNIIITEDNLELYYKTSEKYFNSRLSSGQVKIVSGKDKSEIIDIINELYCVYKDQTLVFIDQIDSYHVSLQHGFLKILEESPKNLYFVLVSKSLNNILPTIISRTKIVNITDQIKLKMLDQDLFEKVKDKLPRPSEFVRELINSKINGLLVNIPDLTKVERDEIDFWLWQVLFNLKTLRTTNDLQVIPTLISSTILALDSNSKSLQKKFVFENFNLD